MSALNADPILVIEAAYDLESDLPDWLLRVATALLPLVDQGFGMFTYQVDLSGAERFLKVISLGAAAARADPYQSTPYVPPAFFAGLFQGISLLGWATEHAERLARRAPALPQANLDEFFALTERQFGYSDVFAITVAPAGAGPVQFSVPGHRRPLGRAERRLWGQLGGHIEAGLRLRQARSTVEAVVEPSGRVAHAEGEARAPEALAGLSDAARRSERARGRLRRDDPLEAAALWTALVQGRWSLVEHFDTDGRRFLLVRRNDATAAEPRPLTPRERQVADLVRRGRSNKMVAYELGLAESTVSELLRSALRKLGLRHRVELVGLMTGRSTTERR